MKFHNVHIFCPYKFKNEEFLGFDTNFSIYMIMIKKIKKIKNIKNIS